MIGEGRLLFNQKLKILSWSILLGVNKKLIFIAKLVINSYVCFVIRKRPLEIISRTMAGLMSRPLTIKMRTGVFKVRIRGPYNSIPNVD